MGQAPWHNHNQGYTPRSFTADQTGDYYIEFQHLVSRPGRWKFFDITVTDASNNIKLTLAANIPAVVYIARLAETNSSFTHTGINISTFSLPMIL
jgi:hypothetical protein